MNEAYWAAIIGVGGTLLGTILGFVLGKITCGKLYVNIKTKDEINYDTQKGKTIYMLTLVIRLFNAAGKNKIVSDVKLLFDCPSYPLLTVSIKDLNTLKIAPYGNSIEDVGINNIMPKTSVYINGRLDLEADKIELVEHAKNIYLQYQNARFHTCKKKLSKSDCQQFLACLMKE